jgi:tol-pal system protein YbgF
MMRHREVSRESRRELGFPVFCVWILAAGWGALMHGCAPRQMTVMQEDTQYIRASLDTLNLNFQNLRMQVDALQIRQDRLVEEMVTQSDLRQHKAYLGSRLDEFQQTSQVISAQLNDLSQRLTGVAQRVDEMKYAAKAPSTADTTAGSEAVAAEPRQLYDQAYLDLSRGNFDLAKGGFEEYLRLYPDTELADNALYWLGEADYVQHDYRSAIEKFQEVEKRYPQGNKVPSALFKIGLCQVQLKQKQKARETFRRIMDSYPGSPEAAQSKDRLQELK